MRKRRRDQKKGKGRDQSKRRVVNWLRTKMKVNKKKKKEDDDDDDENDKDSEENTIKWKTKKAKRKRVNTKFAFTSCWFVSNSLQESLLQHFIKFERESRKRMWLSIFLQNGICGKNILNNKKYFSSFWMYFPKKSETHAWPYMGCEISVSGMLKKVNMKLE